MRIEIGPYFAHRALVFVIDHGDLRADLLDHDVHDVPHLEQKSFLHRGELRREVRGEVRGEVRRELRGEVRGELREILLGDWLVLVGHDGRRLRGRQPSSQEEDSVEHSFAASS